MHRVPVLFLALFALVGCDWLGSGAAVLDGRIATDTPLTESDMKHFLAVVRNHEGAMIPEFTPPDDDDPPDLTLPAKDIVEEFRDKFRRVFDTERQGTAWARDEDWKEAFTARKISGERFAGLVRNVSLAIMRVRLEARVDVAQLIANARRDVERATRIMDDIDALPPRDRTAESGTLRSRSALELGRSVALLEFAELIDQVPEETTALVRRFSKQLKPLLPAHANEDLLAELSQLATRDGKGIQQAGFETEKRKRPAASRR